MVFLKNSDAVRSCLTKFQHEKFKNDEGKIKEIKKILRLFLVCHLLQETKSVTFLAS